MYQENLPSKYLDTAVNEFAKLPGIGKKTALRLILHLLRQEKEEIELFGNSILDLPKNIKKCHICNNISDSDICSICSDPKRDNSTVCVTENITELMAIEKTGQFHGVYHVLGGLISPMEGIGPSDLEFSKLTQKAEKGIVKEVILALSTTPEGDTTSFYIYRKLAKYKLEITSLARGVSTGNELEYTDEITLGRSLVNRVKFEIT